MTERAKTLRYASDDDADSLLADILDSTEDQARAEQAELDKSMVARRAMEDQAKAEAHAARLAQRQAKLEHELERQAELAKRRTLKMQALNPEPPPEPAAEAPAEVTPSLDEAAIRKQIAEEVREELRAIGMTPMPEPQAPVRTPNRVGGMIAAAAALLLAGGVGIAGVVLQGGYKPDPNPYAKAVFAPMDRDAVALEMGSVPIPKAAPILEEQETPRKSSGVRARVSPTPKEHRPEPSPFGKPKKKSDAAKSLDKFGGFLDDAADPFGDNK